MPFLLSLQRATLNNRVASPLFSNLGFNWPEETSASRTRTLTLTNLSATFDLSSSSLGKGFYFTPFNSSQIRALLVALYLIPSSHPVHIFSFPSTMPITNGDVASSVAPLLRNKTILDHTKALEYLEREYSHDGLDVHTLLNSKNNGALTYNDFLILPGYIGNHFSPLLRDLP
jgi:hypothetical protein